MRRTANFWGLVSADGCGTTVFKKLQVLVLIFKRRKIRWFYCVQSTRSPFVYKGTKMHDRTTFRNGIQLWHSSRKRQVASRSYDIDRRRPTCISRSRVNSIAYVGVLVFHSQLTWRITQLQKHNFQNKSYLLLISEAMYCIYSTWKSNNYSQNGQWYAFPLKVLWRKVQYCTNDS